jgi:hypothetical protein
MKLSMFFAINGRPDDTAGIVFKGVASTNGSRNWEATASE